MSGERRPLWGKDAEKYLLPGETPVVATRRHPAVLARPVVRGVPALVVGGWLLQLDPGNRVSSTVGLLVILGALLYLGLHVGEWWIRHFLITRRRVLLTSGVIVRTVAVMPLRRITDLTWKETVVGQLLDYGTFRFESAGQKQGLDEVTYLPHADVLYKRVSELMFGSDSATMSLGEEEDGSASLAERAPARVEPRRSEADAARRDTAPIPRLPPPAGPGA